MSFTYTAGGSGHHAVRFRIPDTVEASKLFDDEELNGLLADNSGNVWLAAAEALEVVANSASMIAVWYQITGMMMNRQQVPKHLRDGAQRLREAAATVPFEFESAVHTYVDSAGRDRSAYASDLGWPP